MCKETEKLFNDFPPVLSQEWKEKIIKDLKGGDFSKLIHKTDFGSEFQPFYMQKDLKDINFKYNNPGEFPFVRGTKQDNKWEIRQEIIVNDIEEANNFAVNLLKNGVESLCFCFNKRHIGDIGDLTLLLQNIDISKTPVSFKYQDNILLLQELLILFIELNNIDVKKISGNLGYNPYEDLLKTGKLPDNEDEELNLLHKIIKTNKERLGNYESINVAADIYKNSGTTILQEIAFALSQAVEYINEYTEKEQNAIEDILKQLSFTFATGSDYFFEIAKYRTIKMLWAKIIDAYGVNNNELKKIKINTINAKQNKTVYDAYVNMLRVTTETMSAVISGCNSVSVLPFDVCYKYPDDFSYRIAKNTQIILKEESYFDKIVDPAGGSYYIEQLTKKIADKSWKIFLEIENNGGFYQNILNNNIQNMIEESAKQKNMLAAQGKINILGTNKYPNQSETANEKLKFNSDYQDNNNKFPIKQLKEYRIAKEFEKLRLKTEKSEKIPTVLLFTYGNLAMRKARAMFSSNFFAIAGFKIIDNPGFDTIEQGIAEINKQNPDIIVACSSDDEYQEFVPELKEKLQNKILVVAGYPKNLIEDFKAKGIENFIHTKSNILKELNRYQELTNNK